MSVLENMKEVADIVKKIGDIELNRKILTLETEVIELTREKRRADERVEELERTMKFKAELSFKEPFYWMPGDAVPYCAHCWEDARKAVHVIYGHSNSSGQYWHCPNCKTHYTTHNIPGRY